MKQSLLKAPLVVVSGASGSGKTTLCKMVAKRLGFHYAISHTTRPKRSGEIEGVDYYFVSKTRFDSMIASDDFLEWAVVYDNCYGTSKNTLFDFINRGQGVIVDVDTQGAKSIKSKIPKAVTVFIQVPSFDELKKRLVSRRTDTPEVLQKRLDQAAHEESQKSSYDFIVVNDNLDQAYSELEEIINKC